MLQLNRVDNNVVYVHLGPKALDVGTNISVSAESVMTNETVTASFTVATSTDRATTITIDASTFALGMYIVTIKNEALTETYAELLAYVSSPTGVPLPEPTYNEYSQQVTAKVYGG